MVSSHEQLCKYGGEDNGGNGKRRGERLLGRLLCKLWLGGGDELFSNNWGVLIKGTCGEKGRFLWWSLQGILVLRPDKLDSLLGLYLLILECFKLVLIVDLELGGEDVSKSSKSLAKRKEEGDSFFRKYLTVKLEYKLRSVSKANWEKEHWKTNFTLS